MPKAPRKTAPKARSDPLATTDKNKSKKQPKSQDKPANSSTTHDAQAPKTPAAESYLLLIRLTSSEDPTITRLLSVPSSFTFEKLHEVMQIAFGWTNSHLYKFSVSKLLEEGETPSWLAGSGKELLTLHSEDFDPVFTPEPEEKMASDYTLADIYDGEDHRGKVEVTYEYDFGDGWDHHIAFLGRADPSLRKSMGIPGYLEVVCLGGEGHPCAEDCGGSGGWESLKDAFKKKGDADGRKKWYKQGCGNGDPKGLDPWKWDVFDVNDELAKIKG